MNRSFGDGPPAGSAGEQQWAPARKLFAWKCKNCQAKNNEHLRILLPRVRIYGSGIGASRMNGQFTFFKSGVGLTVGFWGNRPLHSCNTITDFSIDDAEGFQKRYTATRIFAFDIFAAAVPKWQGTSRLTIRAGDEGWTAMFNAPLLALSRRCCPPGSCGRCIDPSKKSGNQLKHRPRTSPHRFANSASSWIGSSSRAGFRLQKPPRPPPQPQSRRGLGLTGSLAI